MFFYLLVAFWFKEQQKYSRFVCKLWKALWQGLKSNIFSQCVIFLDDACCTSCNQILSTVLHIKILWIELFGVYPVGSSWLYAKICVSALVRSVPGLRRDVEMSAGVAVTEWDLLLLSNSNRCQVCCLWLKGVKLRCQLFITVVTLSGKFWCW